MKWFKTKVNIVGITTDGHEVKVKFKTIRNLSDFTQGDLKEHVLRMYGFKLRTIKSINGKEI